MDSIFAYHIAFQKFANLTNPHRSIKKDKELNKLFESFTKTTLTTVKNVFDLGCGPKS